MESLSLKYGIHRKIQRQDVYADVMKLYQTSKDEIMNEYPFRVEFVGEKAVDIGGVSRDMFSGFFEEAYHKRFEGTSLVTPAIHPGMDLSSLPVLGSIISHAYLVSGTLPIRIAFPCLAAMLLSECQLPDEVLINTFIDSLSVHDAMVLKQAFGEVRNQLPSFSADVMSGLHHVLSFYGCREVPRPQTLKHIVLQIANFEFKMKPSAAIASIRSGIPTKHLPFWEKMSIADFYSTYTALSVSPAKVLKMMDDCLTSNPCEERVLSYLRQYVGNMHLDELRAFLRYITGSCVCTSEGIAVTFNCLDGFGRRPIAHTCSCTLELPTTYVTYTDFVTEFQSVLRNEDYAWNMDAV